MPVRHRMGGRGEGEQIVHALGDFRRASKTVAHLSGDPARIGGAGAKGPGDFFGKRARLGVLRIGGVEMVERRRGPGAFGRRGETALVIGEGVGIEHVLAGQVLHVNKGVGRRDAGAKLPGLARLGAVIGVAGRLKIGRAEVFARQRPR